MYYFSNQLFNQHFDLLFDELTIPRGRKNINTKTETKVSVSSRKVSGGTIIMPNICLIAL